jgi:glycosyltransferase involved in cell wall biosynthesis
MSDRAAPDTDLVTPGKPATREYLVRDPRESDFTGTTIDPDHLPLVSFCIPTKNNEDTLGRCLESIVQQNYPRTEIIIIDGHSEDGTIAIAKKYRTKILTDPGTYGSACQTGIECAQGGIVALFDSDLVIPHRDWLRHAVRYFNYDDRVSSVWPLYTAPPGSPGVEHLYQTKLYRLLMEDRIRNQRSVFGGGNTLFR